MEEFFFFSNRIESRRGKRKRKNANANKGKKRQTVIRHV